MGKMVECGKVNPASECPHVVRGTNEEEVLRNASLHAREHGVEPTPELLDLIKRFIADEEPGSA